ncbi:MAG: site-2 protease family protein [Dehalococcoidia bacterium]|nr:site-2 protease family protein [Dehalococcoidia bacterium]MDW8119859.1 site-2 protease family protein [Chloroflexota bacterium]
MLFRYLPLLREDPILFGVLMGVTVVALVVALTVHEFSHALVATSLGDRTAQRQGRLSLNPLAHLDPIGTLLLFLVGFGWGKPVPVNPLAFGQRAFQGMAVVAGAGPLSNILCAAAAALPFRTGFLDFPRWGVLYPTTGEALVALVLGFIVIYNIFLAAFNLLPFFPLDGSRVVLGLVPERWAEVLVRLEPWGPGVLLVLLLVDSLLGLGLFSRLLGPVVNGLAGVLVGVRVL